MTARILIYADEQGNPYRLPNHEPPITLREVASDILRNFARRPQDIPLFADHQWSKAYGWVAALEEREDGLYAIIDLTDEGEELVASESYKYVSPGLQRDIQLPNGEIIEGWSLVEVSLTNMPAQFGAAIVRLSRVGLQRDALDEVDLPQQLKQRLISPIENKLQEVQTMNREQLTEALLEIITPLQQRLEQIEQTLNQHAQRQAQQAQREEEERLEQTILSWRYDNEQVIPPAIARSYAKLLARLPEHERTDALNTLRNTPPALVPLSRVAATNAQQTINIDPLTEKYARQLGISAEVVAKYKEVQ